MDDEQHAGNGLRITLKDLYQSQQTIDRRLAETFADLKVTLVKIQTHLDTVDQRNQAADELHREHGRRIGEVERVIDMTGVRSLREDRQRIADAFEARLRKLEYEDVSAAAVAEATDRAADARSKARVAFWGMVVALATAIGALVTLLVAIVSHAHL